MEINRSSVKYITRPTLSLPPVQKHMIHWIITRSEVKVSVRSCKSSTESVSPCEVNDVSVQHKCLQRSSTSAARDARELHNTYYRRRAHHTTDWRGHALTDKLTYLFKWADDLKQKIILYLWMHRGNIWWRVFCSHV